MAPPFSLRYTTAYGSMLHSTKHSTTVFDNRDLSHGDRDHLLLVYPIRKLLFT